MADYNSDITEKSYVCTNCGDDTKNLQHCDECEKQYQKECREQEEFDREMEEEAIRTGCKVLFCLNDKMIGDYCWRCKIKKTFNQLDKI